VRLGGSIDIIGLVGGPVRSSLFLALNARLAMIMFNPTPYSSHVRFLSPDIVFHCFDLPKLRLLSTERHGPRRYRCPYDIPQPSHSRPIRRLRPTVRSLVLLFSTGINIESTPRTGSMTW
jgi:hypothetical protein